MTRAISIDVRRAPWALAILTTLIPGQAKPETAAGTGTDLTFGVYTTDKPTVMYKTFTPLLEALQDSMEKRLHRPVSIELRIIKSYSGARRALVTGEVDFVRFGPASYVLAKRENPKITLLAIETKKGKKTFKGFIVVRANSGIRKLTDLRGKRFAFGNVNSTIGRYLAQTALLGAGIHARDLAAFKYLGRHDKVFHAVRLGAYDAGALKAGTFNKLNKTKQLRILASFDNVTKPWVARADLDAKLRETLEISLTSLTDKTALESLRADSLVAAHDRDFAVIRASMKAAQKFERAAARPAEHPRPNARPAKD